MVEDILESVRAFETQSALSRLLIPLYARGVTVSQSSVQASGLTNTNAGTSHPVLRKAIELGFMKLRQREG